MSKKRQTQERTADVFRDIKVLGDVIASRDQAGYQDTPVDLLVPNRFNPRQEFSPEALEELAGSMAEHGFMGALDGRIIEDGRIELAYGARRLLAARMASIETIPVFVHDWDNSKMRFISLIENLNREDLTPLEEATAVGQLHTELGMSHREIAHVLHRPRSWVQDSLALFQAPEDVKEMVAARSDALRAARFIARIPDEEARRALEEKVIEVELTTRQVQRAVQQVQTGTPIEEALTAVTVEAETMPPVAPVPETQLDARASSEKEPKKDLRVLPEGAVEIPPESPVAPTPPPQLDARASSEEDEEAALVLTEEQPVGSKWVIAAAGALDRFSPEAVLEKDVERMIKLLDQILTRATSLREALLDRASEEASDT